MPLEVGKWLPIDIHIHTGLSPCAEDDMSPWNIVRMALLEGLHLIAITDHNTVANCGAVISVGGKLGLTVLPGMEVQTQEEVHLIAIFPTLEAAIAFENFIWQYLPPLSNQASIFGNQILYNEKDEQIGLMDRLLLQSVEMGIEDVGKAIMEFEGLIVASHVNRRAYSLIGQLGFVPPALPLDAVEIDSAFPLEQFHKEYGQLQEYPVLRNSDAHRLYDLVGWSRSELFLEAPDFQGIREVLRSKDLKRIRIR